MFLEEGSPVSSARLPPTFLGGGDGRRQLPAPSLTKSGFRCSGSPGAGSDRTRISFSRANDGGGVALEDRLVSLCFNARKDCQRRWAERRERSPPASCSFALRLSDTTPSSVSASKLSGVILRTSSNFRCASGKRRKVHMERPRVETGGSRCADRVAQLRSK